MEEFSLIYTMLYYIQPFIYYYLGVVNLLAFFVMLYDKVVSKKNKVRLRVPEKTLLMLGAIGGALGVLLAMAIFRHKTKHSNFKVMIPLFFIIWLFIVGYIYFAI